MNNIHLHYNNDKRKSRALRKFIYKLGISSASSFDIDDAIIDLMESLEVGMYQGGKPDSYIVSPATFQSLRETLKK